MLETGCPCYWPVIANYKLGQLAPLLAFWCDLSLACGCHGVALTGLGQNVLLLSLLGLVLGRGYLVCLYSARLSLKPIYALFSLSVAVVREGQHALAVSGHS